MSEDERNERLLKSLLGRDPGETDEDLVAALRESNDGRGLLEIHDMLDKTKPDIPDPGEVAFKRMRRGVLATLRAEGGAGRAFSRRMPPWLTGLAAAAAGVAILLAGVAIGRSDIGDVELAGDATQPLRYTGKTLAEGMQRAALTHDRLADVDDSPFLYSDVRVREIDANRLALSFNVTTHMDLVRPKDDPLVNEVLVQAMLNSSSLGARLHALDYAGTTLDSRVRDALVRAMLVDPDTVMRLKAMEKLSAAGAVADPSVQQALLTVLERDESVQMRLLAIDNLSVDRLDSDVLDRIFEAGPEETTRPLELRARQRLAKL